jgi:hypothetical protein
MLLGVTSDFMDKTQIILADVVGIIVVLAIAVGGLLLLRSFMRRLQSGQGPMGSVLQETREVARERLQVERELLAAQKETNELLKQMIAKQKP